MNRQELYRDIRLAIVVIAAFALITGAGFAAHAYDTNIEQRTAEIQKAADKRIAEVTAKNEHEARAEFNKELKLCLTALDLADKSIFTYFDGVRAERDGSVTDETRKVRTEHENDAYGAFVSVRDECRAAAKGNPSTP